MTDFSSNRKVLLWGGGGQARIVCEMLRENTAGIVEIIFDITIRELAFQCGGLFINDPSELKANLHKVTHYVTCIGAEHGYARAMTSRYLERLGLQPISLIHEKSFIEPTATLGTACQIMPCVVVHKFSEIGAYAILNTNSTIDHQCVVGDGVHVMSGATISGRVRIGDYATIGTNATILPNKAIGEGAYIGAGAVVIEDVEPYSIVVGVPARRLRGIKPRFIEDPLIYLLKK
jgi:sugar O-acyltransferase (sialic acid O-acetyltransferase NeuD family)